VKELRGNGIAMYFADVHAPCSRIVAGQACLISSAKIMCTPPWIGRPQPRSR